MYDKYIIEPMPQYFAYRIWDTAARKVVCICLTKDEAQRVCRELNWQLTA